MISNALQEAVGSKGDVAFWNYKDATKGDECDCSISLESSIGKGKLREMSLLFGNSGYGSVAF